MNDNPYEPATEPATEAATELATELATGTDVAHASGGRSGPSIWGWPIAIGAAVCALMLAGPGLASLSMEFVPRMPAGQRYATYDPEYFLLGYPVSVSTARWVGFTAGPALLAIAIVAFRSARRSRSAGRPQN